MRTIKLAISAAIFILASPGCSLPDGRAQRNAELSACGLQGDRSITADVTMHACSPDQTKKTTICHIPPGNPANAHTICVGNAAVPAHVQNHGDTFGECPSEPPCDPPPDAGVDGGSGSGGDAGGGSDAGGGTDADSGDGGVIF